jgi:hypothetical protein
MYDLVFMPAGLQESLGRPAAPLPFPAGGVPNVGSQPQQFEGMDDEEEAEAAPTVTMKFLVRRQGGSKEDKPRELQVGAADAWPGSGLGFHPSRGCPEAAHSMMHHVSA